jgi:large conductance mechanosensitive channel
MWENLKKFLLRGNVIDLAVGVIIGGAFGSIVNSLVNDIIMPPVGLLLGEVDFKDLYLLLKNGIPAAPYATLADAQTAGAVTLNYGVFLNSVISFLIIGLAVFMLIRGINHLVEEKEQETPAKPTEKTCPFCATQIPIEAVRCPHCTSVLDQ